MSSRIALRLTRTLACATRNPTLCVAIRGYKAPPAAPETFYKHGLHRSDAEVLVNNVPVIEVDGNIAVCDGGSGGLGHPLEYIQLHTFTDEPQICKYCGLRYKSKHHH